MQLKNLLICFVAIITFMGAGNVTMAEKDKPKYYGEVLDTCEQDGMVEIYREASRGSDVLEKLKDYERVEVLKVVPYGWLKVRLSDGTDGYAESKTVRMEKLPPHNYKVREEGHTIRYSEAEQLLTLYLDGKEVLKSKGSSGVHEYFTPKGIFAIDRDHSGEEAYSSEFGQGYKDYISFYEAGYLFHSVPYSQKGYVIREENRKLGEPASHGCIRLPVPVANYLYKNISDGALVIIE